MSEEKHNFKKGDMVFYHYASDEEPCVARILEVEGDIVELEAYTNNDRNALEIEPEKDRTHVRNITEFVIKPDRNK